MEENLNMANNDVPQEPATEPKPEPQKEQPQSIDELAEMKLKMQKYKLAMDKALHDTADYKKKLRDKQTEDEIAAQEKAEAESKRQEEYDKLLRENKITKYEKNFLKLGYPSKLAEKAAVAQADNAIESLFDIQQIFIASRDKAMKSDSMKNMPTPPSGNGENSCSVTKEQFERFGYTARVEFKAKHPELYKNYTE